MSARAALAAFGAALVFVAAACAGGEGDKAGGEQQAQPLVLTLESEDDRSLTGAPEFADAVDRLSEGSMRIELVPAGRSTEIEWEKGVVEDIRGGKAQLGIGDARVWDTIGVKSFQALLAPFLVDSLELELQVLESQLATRMLEGVEQAGVVGIALLPGPVRSPFGITHPLLGPDDYRGVTIGARPGSLMRTALRALGAEAKVYMPGVLSGLDGAESNPKAIDYNSWEGALTTNVVLWPKPYTIFMNRDAFDALTLVSASTADRAALRKAVQPVYEELESDPETKELIGDITEMRSAKSAVASPLSRCRSARGSANAGATALEGRWKLTFTRADLIAVGVPEKLAKNAPENAVGEFANGHYTGIANGRVVAKGTYTVSGDVMSLIFDAPVPDGYIAGNVYRQRWNVYRDTLTFSRFHDSDADFVLLAHPLTRIR
jgi:TRAP-type C4-dicarboxylate transport system substrate-binding protein